MALQSLTEHSAVLHETWPMDRPTDIVIAERLLAAALFNFHRAVTRRGGSVTDFKSWPELSEEQRAFLVDWAIPQAMTAIWKGR